MANLHRFHSFKALLFILSISAASLANAAGWVSMGGPLGGLGYDVRIHPGNKNIMYVTDNLAGVSKSINAGQTWLPTNSGITTKGGNSGDAVNIFSLTIDPNNSNTIWAGTFGEGQSFGVYKSDDAGATWASKTNGISLGTDAGLVFRGFTIQPGNSNVVYAQAEVLPASNPMGWIFQRVKGRVYKTVDGGANWQLIWEGNDLARYLIIDPGNSSILYVSHGIFDREPFDSDCAKGVFAGVGVLKSSDGGQTWTAINSGITDLAVGSLRMHPTNSQILFAATGNNACSGFGTSNMLGGVFKTINGGVSWTKVLASRNGEPFTAVNFSPANPNTVYAGSSQAFYRSDNLGATWTQYQKEGIPTYGPPGVAAGFPIDVVIDPDNPNTVYVNNYAGGVFRSLDGTATWQNWSKGYTGASIRRMALSVGNPSALAVIGKSGPFASPDYGRDWVGILNGDAATLAMFNWATVAVHPTNPAVILLADSNAGVVFRSTDNGNNFTKVLKDANAQPIGSNDPLRFQGFRGLAFAPSDPNIVYAGVSVDTSYHTPTPIGTVIYKSTDGGGTFTATPSVIDGNNVNRLIVDSSSSNNVYAATTNGVYKSSNGAASWTYSSALGSRKIESLAVKSGTLIAGEVAGGIWTSADDGATWTGPHNTGISSSNPTISALVFDTANANVVYAGDIYSGVYKSSDKGLTWSPFPDSGMSGLTMRAVNDLVLTNEVLYAATEGGGVFRYDFQPPPAVPVCTLSASATSISAGGTSTLTPSCSPSATSYVWTGGTCTGTTGSSCTVTPAATTTYTVAGVNIGGTGATVSATVTVNKLSQTIGTISFSPSSLAVGGTTIASASATSGLSITFSSTTPTICSVSGSTVTGVASGTCAVAADQAGNGTYAAATQVTQTISVSAPPSSRLVNLSTRGSVQTGDNVMIGGFVIGGTSPKKVLVRAVGPNLANYGVNGVLANPMLELHKSSDGSIIASNDDWGSAADATEISATTLAPVDSKEAAILTTLDPGAYTAIVSGSGGGTGVGIVEVYDIDHPEIPLVNLSTRGQVQTGNNVMIGGFIIQGDSPQTVLIRAVGPNLANYGVTGVLADPTLELHRSSDGTIIASNDNWQTASNAAAITATGLAPESPLESAILISLPPGAYTAIVRGADGGTGVGIVEVYAQ